MDFVCLYVWLPWQQPIRFCKTRKTSCSYFYFWHLIKSVVYNKYPIIIYSFEFKDDGLYLLLISTLSILPDTQLKSINMCYTKLLNCPIILFLENHTNLFIIWRFKSPYECKQDFELVKNTPNSRWKGGRYREAHGIHKTTTVQHN